MSAGNVGKGFARRLGGGLGVIATVIAVLNGGSAYGDNGTGWAGTIGLGAHVCPNGNPCTEAQVTAFQTACGNCISSESTYPGFAWSKAYASRWNWDVQNYLAPLIIWSPRLGHSCATYVDINAGKYDSTINANAAIIKTLNVPVTISLFPEPTDNAPEICAGTTASDYLAAWQYITGMFAADGVTNVTWLQAFTQTEWANGVPATWYAGSLVNTVGIDAYNGTNGQEQFPAAVCADATALGKPYWITETGAFADEQAIWFASIPANCSGVGAVFAFDSPGIPPNNYVLGTEGLAAFESIQ